MQRLIHSAKIYRMPLPYSLEQLNEAVIETVEANGVTPVLHPAHRLPRLRRDRREPRWQRAMSRFISRTSRGASTWPATAGADVCVSSWNRLAPNTMPSLAKAGANYMNSQLIRMEAGDQRLRGRHRPGHATATSERGLRREPVPHPRWRAVHHRRSPTPCSTASRVTPFSCWPAKWAFPIVEQSIAARVPLHL